MERGLTRHPDFLKLWAGQTVSVFGSQVTSLALPLTAVLVLGAGPRQIGWLNALQFAPFLLFGLFAGVWVDRMRRRPVLIAADLGRALFIGSIPVAAAAGRLRLEHLYLVGFCNGVLTVFFDVAWQAYMPALVQRANLVSGNSRLETTRSLAQAAGPGLAGGLVQLLTASSALAVDAVSFLVSALCIGLIRQPEAAAPRGKRRNIWAEIGEGLHFVTRHPLLGPIALCTALLNLFGGMVGALFLVYATRDLHLKPAAVGAGLACAGVGGLVSSLLAGRAARRLGLGRAITIGAAVLASGPLLIAAYAGPPLASAVWLAAVWFVSTLGSPLYNINQLSLRQAITPDRLQGRANATMRFLVWGTIPVGAIAGGLLGGAVGARAALFVAGGCQMLGLVPLLLSRVRGLKEAPSGAA